MLGTRVVLALAAVLFTCQLVRNPSSYGGMFAAAKEIEATHEWTVIGENDTVAAGMHIRMDMTTGEKWVKLMDDEEDEDDDDGSEGSSYSSSTELSVHNVQIGADGTVEEVSNDNDDDDDEADDDNDKTEKNGPNYDFDMMHRTLSHLPKEEKSRIGLPPLPKAPLFRKKVTPAQRALFEAQMKQIWEDRQEEIRKFGDDNVADLPAILKDRIQRIRDYLANPYEHLIGMDLQADRNPDQVTHIVSVLEDLEYHLADIDMARDFHTLSGWPLLLSLLSDEVHVQLVSSNNHTTGMDTTTTTTTATMDMDMDVLLREKVHVIQATAAWAVGTAVKNTGEFIPYAVEEFSIGIRESTKKTCAVDLLLAQFTATSGIPEYHSSLPVVKKLQKLVYGLGSLLRANRPAQAHFCAAGGAESLGATLIGLLDGNTNSPHAKKMAERLLMLADDIVSDVMLHEVESEHDAPIIRAFSSDQWCELAVLALAGDPAIHETALKTIATLTGQCSSWDMDLVQQSIIQIRDDWKTGGSEMHPDILKERLQLIESTMTLLQEVKN